MKVKFTVRVVILCLYLSTRCLNYKSLNKNNSTLIRDSDVTPTITITLPPRLNESAS